ncbi:MAG: biotin--protein ligase [Candidatus Marsarchaeota archaeon]|nr:biotin--protein ligase [Candidatus Marsarchaeota archaeon]
MEGSSKLKVPGGKLIVIKLSYDDRIRGIQILGDFFMHPEEALGLIESLLAGTKSSASREEIAGRIRAIAEQRHVEMIGVSPESIADAIKMAIK